MGNYYLAVDIGASSGRHILGSIEDGKIVIEELYRFDNGMVRKDGHLCWDTESLFSEIKAGMKKCKESGKIPSSMGIDTWGVDYVLLDKDGEVLGETYGYRDKRTKGMDQEVYKIIPQEDLYLRTGIQKQIFNTIYQLMAMKQQEPQLMEQTDTFLMIPDYFHYLLTGNKISDYTNATTGQLVNPETKKWDMELIEKLGFNAKMFRPLSMPTTKVGNLLPEIEAEVDFNCEVVLPPTHDTAAAVMAVPVREDKCLYISSGTWSLMGTESPKAIRTKDSMDRNFTNEGGFDYRFRFLKNIMGLWMIQSVRHEYDDKYSFAELCNMAEKEKDFPTRIHVNDDDFLAPENMTWQIQDYCRRIGEPVPETAGQVAAVIYQSLADSYAETAREIEKITGESFDAIHIVGGGSNADYLNQLTAEKSGKIVYAGPGEATAIGNLAAQMIKAGEFRNLQEVRACIYDSFDIIKYD